MHRCLFPLEALLQLRRVQLEMGRDAEVGEVVRLLMDGLDLSAIGAMHFHPGGQLFVALPTCWWALLAAQVAALPGQLLLGQNCSKWKPEDFVLMRIFSLIL